MNSIEELLLEVKNELDNEECVKEYFRLKKFLIENEDLKKLDKEMKIHQKNMCENINNDEIYLKEKSLYEEYKKQIENNPSWQNFQIVKEEVYSLLVDIKKLLS